MQHELLNLNEEKAILTKERIGYAIEYGTIAKGSDSEVKLLLSIGNITDVKISSSCGCTASTVEQQDNNYIIKISYDTNRIGNFEKTVRLDFMKNKVKSRLEIKVKGKVV